MIRATLLALAMLAPGAALAQACAPETVEIRGDFGSARFTVEIADDPDERAQGLMFRESMSPSRGMLFLYQEPGAPSFWMRNTLIPLDMLFITETGVVQSVHENAIPGDLTGISGGSGILAVLEINGGMARAIGIEEGAEMRHPAFAQDGAVWPCE